MSVVLHDVLVTLHDVNCKTATEMTSGLFQL